MINTSFNKWLEIDFIQFFSRLKFIFSAAPPDWCILHVPSHGSVYLHHSSILDGVFHTLKYQKWLAHVLWALDSDQNLTILHSYSFMKISPDFIVRLPSFIISNGRGQFKANTESLTEKKIGMVTFWKYFFIFWPTYILCIIIRNKECKIIPHENQ